MSRPDSPAVGLGNVDDDQGFVSGWIVSMVSQHWLSLGLLDEDVE